MKIGNKEFSFGTHIMGILNITPDSFSDGGKWNSTELALHRVEQMISEGAEVIDIGGESTRPGHKKISDEEEIARILPTISAIKSRFDIPVSVDTYKRTVAEAALNEGADMVNDIWGFQYSENMAEIAKKYDAACCLMHNRNEAVYGDFKNDIISDLKESISIAKAAGISDDKIILDPGVGFAKTQEQNLFLIENLCVLEELGYPLLLGTSRKSVIGNVLDLPAHERLEGTVVTTVRAVEQRCLFVRVHDIKENMRAIKMTCALMESRKYYG